MKVEYVGGEKGQSDRIEIRGQRFERGKTYDLSEKQYKDLGLEAKGGFKVVSEPKAKGSTKGGENV